MKTSLKKAAATTALVGGGLVLWTAATAAAATAMVPADGAFVDVPGGRLHYVDTGGPGPVAVMLHGLYGQLRNFSYALADELSGYRLILVDRPGWGYSTVTGTQPTVEEQARMVADLIDALGLTRPLLVGHSMGGAVALALALNHPAKVRAVALIAPLTQPMREMPAILRTPPAPAPLRGLAAWTTAVPFLTLTGGAMAKHVFSPDPVPGDFGTHGGGALALRPSSYEAGTFELHDANRSMKAMTPRYGDITTPVAILYGRDDKLLDPALQGTRTAGEIPGATLKMIAGGHMIPVTHPAETAAWLREVATRA